MGALIVRRSRSGSCIARWLALAATPTFAIMALMTGILDMGGHGMMCSPGSGASVLAGMVPMYLLMGAFHVAPWLRLISKRTAGSPECSQSRSSKEIGFHERGSMNSKPGPARHVSLR